MLNLIFWKGWGADEWAALGQWAGAIASFSAVVVSLYLARSSNKPKVQVAARVRVDDNPTRVIEELRITVTATNVGMIPVTMINSSIKLPRGVRWSYICSPHIRFGNVEEVYPKKLDTSDNISYYIKEIDLARSLRQIGFHRGKVAIKVYCMDSFNNVYSTKYIVDMKRWSNFFRWEQSQKAGK